jgi:hypothetical protein
MFSILRWIEDRPPFGGLLSFIWWLDALTSSRSASPAATRSGTHECNQRIRTQESRTENTIDETQNAIQELENVVRVLVAVLAKEVFVGSRKQKRSSKITFQKLCFRKVTFELCLCFLSSTFVSEMSQVVALGGMPKEVLMSLTALFK